MKKYISEFLIISISCWIVSPLIDLFVQSSDNVKLSDYSNEKLIITSLVFGIVFTIVFNLMIKK